MRLSLPQVPTRWAIAAGISYVLCFPSYDLPALSLFFLPFLLACVHSLGSRKQAIKLGFLLSTMVSWGGFHWIVYLAQNFGEMSFAAAIGLQMLYCLVAAPQMVAFLGIAEKIRMPVERLPLTFRPLFWAALYTGLEFFARFIKIFPEHLGNTLIAFPALSQLASLGGVSLLTFLPLWLGASLYYVRKNGRLALPSAFAAFSLLVAGQLWGTYERARITSLPTEIFHVGIVQHNMDDAEKAFARTSRQDAVSTIMSRLVKKTGEVAKMSPAPELILWPETSYPMHYPTFEPLSSGSTFAYGYANLVKDTAVAAGVPLLIGAYESLQRKTYNSGVLLMPNGKVHSAYRKQVLLIFGEYFPFDQYFPSLKMLNPIMGDFGRGPGPEPLLLPWKGGELSLGVNICYEALLPEYMRGYAVKGARVFVNLTKDSWFGDTFEPWQHFQLSALRSIEHRIPLVRSTNSGLSGMVTASGETTILSPPFQEAYRVLAVPLLQTPATTLYTRLGEWFAWLMVGFSFCLGFAALRRE